MTVWLMPASFAGAARPVDPDPYRFRRQHRQGRAVHLPRPGHHLPLPRALRPGAARHLPAGPARAGKTIIYIAERGQTSEVDGQSYLMLEKGTVQREAAQQPRQLDHLLRALCRRSRRFQPGRRRTSSTSRASASTSAAAEPRPERELLPAAGGPLPGRAARPALGAALPDGLHADRLCGARRAAHHPPGPRRQRLPSPSPSWARRESPALRHRAPSLRNPPPSCRLWRAHWSPWSGRCSSSWPVRGPRRWAPA